MRPSGHPGIYHFYPSATGIMEHAKRKHDRGSWGCHCFATGSFANREHLHLPPCLGRLAQEGTRGRVVSIHSRGTNELGTCRLTRRLRKMASSSLDDTLIFLQPRRRGERGERGSFNVEPALEIPGGKLRSRVYARVDRSQLLSRIHERPPGSGPRVRKLIIRGATRKYYGFSVRGDR